MNTKTNNPESFFTPSTLYSLPTAGIAVWISCLVIGSLITDLSSFWFRIIAFTISFLISLSLFHKNKKWRKPSHYILIFLNAALIFVNASGMNTITYSYPFENFRYKKNDSLYLVNTKQFGFFNFASQKNWWPDTKLINEKDSVVLRTLILEREKKGLENQFSFLKDWIQSNIKDKNSRDTLKKIFSNFGHYEMDTLDVGYLKTSFNEKENRLNKKIDSLQNVIKIKNSIEYFTTYEVNGKKLTAEEYVNQLLQENIEINNNYKNLYDTMSFVNRRKDSLLRNLINRLKGIK